MRADVSAAWSFDAAVADATTQYVELQSSAIRESEERFRLLVDSVRDYDIQLPTISTVHAVLHRHGRVNVYRPRQSAHS